MNLETPLFTVIVAVYNGAATLQQCLNSVFHQSYKNVELIVIDGGSTDGTVDILRSNNEHISYWISEPDSGIYNAWNKALTRSTGDWVCFLGSDDFFWSDQVLAHMAKALYDIPSEISIVYGQIMLLSQDGVSLFPVGEPWNKVKNKFKNGMSIPHQAVMHRRRLFENNGNFDETFRIAGDYELMLRDLKSNDAIFVPDLIVTGMRTGGLSGDPINTITVLKEFLRAQQINGVKTSSAIWWYFMFKAYVRKILWSTFGAAQARKMFDAVRCLQKKPALWTKKPLQK